MDERPDDELLIAAGEGDREAFGQFVARHQRAVVGYVQRSLGGADYATAEDLAQDVVVATWQAAPRYRPQAKALAWLYRMATNACLNQQRQARLAPNQRAALLLLHDRELSYAEIGSVLRMSVAAVESVLFRARQRVLVLLAEAARAVPACPARSEEAP